jgi:ADP-ribose pyrophosphatase
MFHAKDAESTRRALREKPPKRLIVIASRETPRQGAHDEANPWSTCMKSHDPLFEPVVARERIFDGRFLLVDRLTVRLPDGRTADREAVVMRNSVAVLPMDSEGNVHLVRQHRPAIGRTILEVPAGLIDGGESASAAAVRECEEETGVRPGRLRELITYAHVEGYSTAFMTLYHATELDRTGKVRLDADEFVEPVTMPFDELLSLVRSNQIIDSKTILCAVMVREMLSIING